MEYHYLENISRSNEYQHNGLGKALVSHIASMPKYAELRGFLVTKDAHGLYEKYGYEIINNRAMMKSPVVK